MKLFSGHRGQVIYCPFGVSTLDLHQTYRNSSQIIMNKLKQTLSAVTGLLFATSTMAVPSVVPNAPTVNATAYVLMDYQTGQILAEENAYEKRAPASLTKMMTSYVLGQEVAQGNVALTDNVKISKKAWSKNFPDSSKMFIEVGKEVKLEDLNRGMVIQSGNDACVAIAEHVAGSEGAFTDLMNAWTAQLGMVDTHFVNAHGLDSTEHFTTAYDMALLGQALIRDVPEEYALYSEKEFTFNKIRQHNRNGLLWDRSLGVDGIKTGHTSNAGYSLVASAERGGMRLVSVVMGAKSASSREAESKKLLNYGFRFFETVTPYKAGDEFISHKIWYGSEPQVSLGVLEDTPVTIYRGQAEKLEANFELTEELKAPLTKGQVVGKVFFQLDGKDIAEYKLVALQDVEEGSWFSKLIDYIKLLVASWFN
ncbi:D-alanyl-D-alanine carboxypeptidase (penicillin-binding protein 5/6) [Ferrimonas sediminum]|uniref:serine-type D-Ala-D-Ala carboxypeptidase n=2 Tax=Ferrimonas sediminum TaxID=718193 RepID=A0A1G8QLJ7_9GAMM|nr:D-alanyl-D-alanine carboxypeptidase (penicillin-binding protein 5/6) [Ferrimonas sediminum]